MFADLGDELPNVNSGDCVAIVFASGERKVARGRIVQFDWHESDRLTDSQLERILAILDERP